MENNKGQTIFLSVVGIATLLVAIVGATFAYFSISVQGNEEASSILVTTAKVGGVEYKSTSDTISIVDAYPGWTATKTFTIATTDMGDDQTIDYTMAFVVTTPDDETNLAKKAIANGDHEFSYSLASVRTGTGETTDLVTKAAETDIPATTATGSIGTGKLRGTETHTYTMNIVFAELGEEQDDLQGKTYAAAILVDVAAGQGTRTYDSTNANGEHWKTWTAG